MFARHGRLTLSATDFPVPFPPWRHPDRWQTVIPASGSATITLPMFQRPICIFFLLIAFMIISQLGVFNYIKNKRKRS